MNKLVYPVIAGCWCALLGAVAFQEHNKVLDLRDDLRAARQKYPEVSLRSYNGTALLWEAKSTNSGFIKFGESNMLIIEWKYLKK